MGALRRAFAWVTALAAISLSAGSALSGELIVMPYSCQVVDGEPQLTPSEDRGYSVIGRREERDFSACSPMQPDLCKQWKIYRFTMDCDGTRVPWASVAANARRDRRAWVEGGRLRIEMPARWAMSPDDPCAREFDGSYGWPGGGFRRFCAERRSLRQPPVVEMPDGFAPMMGLEGIFVADGAKAPRPRVADAEASGPASPPPFALEKVAPPPRSSAPAKKATAASSSKIESAKKALDTPPKEELTQSEMATSYSGQGPTEPDSAAGVKPKIINAPGAKEPAKQADATPAKAAPIAVPTPDQMVTASITKAASTSQPETSSSGLPKPSDGAAAPFISSLTSAGPLTISATSLAILGLIGLTFLSWRARAGFESNTNRDIGTLSLASGRDLVVVRVNPPASRREGPVPAAGPPSNIGTEMPETLEQALRILGMGVTPGVSDVAIKKIVDGLRMSWHPDGAATAEERALRELRTKQINTAWDIINHRRPS